MPIQQGVGAAKVVCRYCLKRQVHIRGVGRVTREQFARFSLCALLLFVGLRLLGDIPGRDSLPGKPGLLALCPSRADGLPGSRHEPKCQCEDNCNARSKREPVSVPSLLEAVSSAWRASDDGFVLQVTFD